mmetsp:Transcript_4679/g.7268  ORF Transcript_4679/g.7268 Transcript_4679/m.7268 type:complete len:349 (+) Transcript_4679:119-1165(+)
MKSFATAAIIFISTYSGVDAFTATGKSPLVAAPVATRKEWTTGVEIELPDFDTLFDRVQTASPLAKHVMEGNSGGFESLAGSDSLKWKKLENNERKTVHRIDKLDSYQNIKTPLLRFRSSIKGPLIGERFSHFIMDLEERKKWDDACARNEEVHPIDDLDAVNTILGDEEKYGTCTRVGVGYTQTKQSIISPREQLIIGGMQEFQNGATMLWGTEMEEQHNYLLPEGQRHTRAKSHLFAATLAPTDVGFDVEYLLQMDVGGGVPNFLATPALVDAIKKLFDHTKRYFEGGEGSELDMHLKSLSSRGSDLEVLREIDEIEESFTVEMDFSKEAAHLHDDASLLPLFFTP